MSEPAGATRAILVGLTGGIGSGKSTVGKMIAAMGLPVLDADRIARQVVEPGRAAHAEIAAAWPEVIGADGHIDRGVLAGIVFADPDARARLEAITHPRIREESRAAAEALRAAGHRLIFYEAALLVEAGRAADFDELVVVVTPEHTQLERAIMRGDQSEDQILARMTAQMPLAEKVRHASYVIDNSGSLANTQTQVEALIGTLCAKYGLSEARALRITEG